MYNAIIVDDEPRAVAALKENIPWKRCGIRKVYEASNIAAAMKTIQEAQIEVLICDIEMPNGYGTSLLKWLRENRFNLSCIFVTCHQEYHLMRQALQLQCYDYILKPIDYEEFTELLSEMVEKMERQEAGERSGKEHFGTLMNTDILKKDEQSLRHIDLEVKRYVREHLSEDMSVAEIAGCLHFHPNYLMRVFKNETGMSILEYIVTARMEAARKLLKGTRLPVKDVADMVGYGDCAYFTRIFHRETGMTPSLFRKLYG
ncbi:MAG: AraC family transcriptional regulator [Clostridiales bacterium]|nr:AraC family transcriptional regulator [Clostridiales bacterium]